MFSGEPYNALKVDVWSLGATVWETAQAEPPFAEVQDPRLIGDRWPPLYQPEIYSRSFHEFLHLCSEPSSSRPDPSELLNVCCHIDLNSNSSFVICRPHSSAMPAGAQSMSNCFHNVELSRKRCSSVKILLIYRNYIFVIYPPS